LATLHLRRVSVRDPAHRSIDFSLIAVISIARRGREGETCTQQLKTKLERLRSARLIYGDQKTITRHAMALSKAKGLISLLAPIKHL
jgi:hypothetical protein